MQPLQIGDRMARLPLIQGGMGVGISLSGLSGAVAKEGGVGLISTAQIGWREPDFDQNPIAANLRALAKEFRKARRMAPEGILGFNIMVATKRYGEYVKAAAAAGADLIVSGAGLPVDLPKFAAGFSTKLAPIVSSSKAAALICKLWDRRYQTAPDLVVVEGPEAGGHLGFSEEEAKSLTKRAFEEEIKRIIETVRGYAGKYRKKIPVVVAGGIYGREDVRHALVDLGADGVQVGTRFVTTEECDAPDAYKKAYLQAKEEDIVITKSPVGMPGRAILNSFLKRSGKKKPALCHQCLEHCRPAEIPYCITDALVNAAKGRMDDALIFCGANAWRSKRMETVPEVMADLFPEG
ncbi:NAD(P)H-dependent flavin oxidoreductase [Hominifimenecus sp. rT4P-3]|uniref:NAD(P)H-dependent flavin oxidoreductase n=1 Tax=Hominifimenecus sp. rT4P-3 TaxID=3242979 RepID=UPI003DA472BC